VTTASILLVEDHAATREHLAAELSHAGYEVVSAGNGREALDAIELRPFDLVLSDYRMAPVDGLALLRSVRRSMNTPFVLYSTAADADAVFRAGRDGALHFLTYPFRVSDQLLPTIRQCLARGVAPDRKREGAERLIGSSTAMRSLRAAIRRVASSDVLVLIHGETGTGKEVVARAIHEESGRKEFVAVAVPELSEGVFESELFGHERGAFTGAVGARRGLFERANGGTLFLDEIGDTPLGMQVKLLRVLETREIRPVGGGTVRAIDVRVVAATHRDLTAMVKAGKFRQDLFYRIRAAAIHLPPLRSHSADVREIAESLLSDATKRTGEGMPAIDPSFWAALESAPWLGNVRELRAVIESALLWREGSEALARAHVVEALVALDPGLTAEEQLLSQRMLDALRRNRWNQEAARRELELTRGEWRTRLARLGLDVVKRRRKR